MKSKEELKTLSNKLCELTEEELEQVTGGTDIKPDGKDNGFEQPGQEDDEYWLGYKKELGSDKNPSEIR